MSMGRFSPPGSYSEDYGRPPRFGMEGTTVTFFGPRLEVLGPYPLIQLKRNYDGIMSNDPYSDRGRVFSSGTMQRTQVVIEIAGAPELEDMIRKMTGQGSMLGNKIPGILVHIGEKAPNTLLMGAVAIDVTYEMQSRRGGETRSRLTFLVDDMMELKGSWRTASSNCLEILGRKPGAGEFFNPALEDRATRKKAAKKEVEKKAAKKKLKPEDMGPEEFLEWADEVQQKDTSQYTATGLQKALDLIDRNAKAPPKETPKRTKPKSKPPEQEEAPTQASVLDFGDEE